MRIILLDSFLRVLRYLICINIVRKIIKACKGSNNPFFSPKRNKNFPCDNGKVREYIKIKKGNINLILN